MASVQRCAAQHPGRRAAETVCRQFQCPRLHFSRRHLRQCGFLGGTVYPSAPESGAAKTLSSSQGVCAGLGDCPVSGRQLGTRASLCRPVATSFGSLHRRLRQQTVLRRLNTKHPPGKGPFAVGAGALSVVAVRRARQPWGRWSWCRCRAPRTACRVVSPGAFAGGGGVSCLFLCCREVGGSFCAGLGRPSGPCASWLPRLWLGCGGPALLLPALQFSSPAHGGSSQPPDNS